MSYPVKSPKAYQLSRIWATWTCHITIYQERYHLEINCKCLMIRHQSMPATQAFAVLFSQRNVLKLIWFMLHQKIIRMEVIMFSFSSAWVLELWWNSGQSSASSCSRRNVELFASHSMIQCMTGFTVYVQAAGGLASLTREMDTRTRYQNQLSVYI